jgi:hypothetical protein
MYGNTFFVVQYKCLKLLGLSQNKTGNQFLMFYTYSILNIFLITPMAKFIFEHVSQIDLATETAAPMFTAVMTMIKMQVFYQNKVKIFKIIQNLQEMSESGEYFRKNLFTKTNEIKLIRRQIHTYTENNNIP